MDESSRDQADNRCEVYVPTSIPASRKSSNVESIRNIDVICYIQPINTVGM